MARPVKFVGVEIHSCAIRTQEPLPRKEAKPAHSDSSIDLDLLLMETFASVKEDVKKIKQSKRHRSSSVQGKKEKDAKKMEFEKRKTDVDKFDCDLLPKSNVAELVDQSAEEEQKMLKGTYASVGEDVGRNNQSINDGSSSADGKKKKDAKEVKIERENVDRGKWDSGTLPARKGAEVVGGSSKEKEKLVKETCASDRQDWGKIKQSKKDRSSGRKRKDVKEVEIERPNADVGKFDSTLPKSNGAEVVGRSSEEGKRFLKETSASAREDVGIIKQSKKDRSTSVEGKKIKDAKIVKTEDKKTKDAKTVKTELLNTDRDKVDSDPLSKSRGAEFEGESSEEEKKWLKQQYLELEATSRQLGFMKEIYVGIIAALKENPTFKN